MHIHSNEYRHKLPWLRTRDGGPLRSRSTPGTGTWWRSPTLSADRVLQHWATGRCNTRTATDAQFPLLHPSDSHNKRCLRSHLDKPMLTRAVEMLGAKTTRSHTCAAVPRSMSCRVLGPPRTTTGALCSRWPARADLRPTSTDTGVQRRLGRGGLPVVTAAFSSPRTNASTSVKGAR